MRFRKLSELRNQSPVTTKTEKKCDLDILAFRPFDTLSEATTHLETYRIVRTSAYLDCVRILSRYIGIFSEKRGRQNQLRNSGVSCDWLVIFLG